MATKQPGSLEDLNFDALQELFRPHIESFDYMIDAGLETMVVNIKPVVVPHPSKPQKLTNILVFLLKLINNDSICFKYAFLFVFFLMFE
jgi:DNA-directed RNA polymerase I subunit RPA2